jgi:hypothetical protein
MNIPATFALTPALLGIVLCACVLVVGGLSIAVLYHWKAYGLEGHFTKVAPVVYLSVLAVLCGLALFAYASMLA